MLAFFQHLLSQPCIAVDLGTAKTRVSICTREEFREEPSLIRHVRQSHSTRAGDEDLAYLNDRIVSSPLRGGVIVDVRNAVALLKPLLRRARPGFRQPVSLACAPTDTSEQERKLLRQALETAGAAHVAIIPEVWAAAMGAGMDTTSPKARVLIDIGEGVTDMAVIRNGRLVFTAAVRTACSDLQKAVRTSVIARHKVCPWPTELERLTHELAARDQAEASPARLIPVRGVDIGKRREKAVAVKSREIIEAMDPVLARILRMIETGLRRLPENIASEIAGADLCLTGGGSCISGMDTLIASATGLAVRVAPDPTHSVINGAIRALRAWEKKENWWETVTWPGLPS